MTGDESAVDSDSPVFCYFDEAHTSLVGMRELVKERGVPVHCFTEAQMVRHLSAPAPAPATAQSVAADEGEDDQTFNLLAMPAQCNYSGRKYPLDWIKGVRDGRLSADFVPGLNAPATVDGESSDGCAAAGAVEVVMVATAAVGEMAAAAATEATAVAPADTDASQTLLQATTGPVPAATGTRGATTAANEHESAASQLPPPSSASIQRRWKVVLDAASYVSTSPLDLSTVSADFVCLSFYKMFGFPTGWQCIYF